MYHERFTIPAKRTRLKLNQFCISHDCDTEYGVMARG